MYTRDEITDELLNAFVDDELSSEEHGRVLALISQDETLRKRACELKKIKDLFQLAYPRLPL